MPRREADVLRPRYRCGAGLADLVECSLGCEHEDLPACHPTLPAGSRVTRQLRDNRSGSEKPLPAPPA
ncbi:hypothetical protein ACFWWT_09230 [Streptomyces sp. NPDC058676]|uniref:hypothetical protein n=1 Tax=unclassified Streptomyces TaxID=2593676 RepID=UPI0036538C52